MKILTYANVVNMVNSKKLKISKSIILKPTTKIEGAVIKFKKKLLQSTNIQVNKIYEKRDG